MTGAVLERARERSRFAAQRADADGDTQIWGLLGCQKEVAFAAKRVIVVVEEVVEESVIRRDPNRTVIPGAVVDAGTCVRARDGGFDPRVSLARADSGSLLEASGDLLHTGATLTNVGDLVLALNPGAVR